MSDTDQFSDLEILAKTIWGECRGGGVTGMSAVANVVMNRLYSGIKWWGCNVRSICLQPYQFSCWNIDDPNRAKMLAVSIEDVAYEQALEIAKDAMDNLLSDVTDGATSYYAASMLKSPPWATGRQACAEIAGQRFYRLT